MIRAGLIATNVILRTSHDPLSMTRSIREAVHTVDPNQPVNVVRTAEDELASAGWARERFCGVPVARLRGFCADARSRRALQYRVVLSVVPIQRIWHPYGARCVPCSMPFTVRPPADRTHLEPL